MPRVKESRACPEGSRVAGRLAPVATDAEARRFRLSATVMIGWMLGALIGLLQVPGIPHLHFSDLWLLYGGRHLASHAWPYIQAPIEYPVLMGWWMWITAWAPGGLAGFLVANFVGLGAVAVVTLRLLRRLAPRHYHWFALSPLIALYALANWDLLAIVWLVAAWVAFERQEPGRTGLYLGLGTATKLFPIVALPFMAYTWWRQGTRRSAVRCISAFGAVWLALNIPFALLNFSNWSLFFRFNAVRPMVADLWSTVPFLSHLTVGQVDGFSLVTVLIAALLGLRAVAHGARTRVVVAAVFGVFFVVNKVFSPQYMLWMLVSAVVAEWPVWTLGVLTLGGLVDFGATFWSLMAGRLLASGHVVSARLAESFHPLGIGIRYLSIAVASLGASKMLGEGGTWREGMAAPSR